VCLLQARRSEDADGKLGEEDDESHGEADESFGEVA